MERAAKARPFTQLNIVPDILRRRIANRPNLLQIVDNIGWLFVDRILRMGVGLLVGVWIARYLGPEQFGSLSFATAFVGLFGAIAGLGLQGIVVRDIVRDPACKEVTLGTAAALQLIGGLLAYGLMLGTVLWLRPDDSLARVLVAILGSMMLFRLSDTAAYWFESQVQSRYTVWVQNATFLVFALIKVMLILLGAPLVAFAWAVTAEALVVSVLMLFVLSLRGPKLGQLVVSLQRAKGLLADSWPLLLSGVAVVIYTKVDQIMLGLLTGDEAVGIYSAAVRVSEVWYFVPVAIVASVFPSILAAKKRNEAQYNLRLQRLYDLMVWLAVAVAVPMTFLSGSVVRLLFGDSYAGAGPVLAIHIWAAVFVFLGVASGQWFLVENRQAMSLQRTVFGALVNVALNSVFIPRYGFLGAAWATVIAQMAAAFLFDLIQRETRAMFLMKLRAMNPISVMTRNRRYLRAE